MIAGGNIVCKDKVHLTSLVTRSARSQIIPILVHMVNPELSQEKVQETSEESLAVVAGMLSSKAKGDFLFPFKCIPYYETKLWILPKVVEMAGKTYARGRERKVVQLGIPVYLHT
ncbi:hypothetical protein QQ045_028238 [Rhodiola kirilowii]